MEARSNPGPARYDLNEVQTEADLRYTVSGHGNKFGRASRPALGSLFRHSVVFRI